MWCGPVLVEVVKSFHFVDLYLNSLCTPTAYLNTTASQPCEFIFFFLQNSSTASKLEPIYFSHHGHHAMGVALPPREPCSTNTNSWEHIWFKKMIFSHHGYHTYHGSSSITKRALLYQHQSWEHIWFLKNDFLPPWLPYIPWE